ncbi:SEL1-like repeat protein [Aquibium microcysteis]|uniref:SEL1-like repeat protein n=1 Tax=Aquibium microcysteis TaxID=675281 RepID=UPI00165D0426|nr:SEL1-like repeat protein [Aquibium microcysteis]
MQNFVSAVVTRLLPILALLVGTGAAQAVELTRNGVAYQVSVTLPEGASFTHSGIDRQFAIQGVRGNLRLIQDRHDECASLLAERIENKAAEGFLKRSDEASSPTECSVTLTDEVLGLSVSSAYLRIDTCDCFAAIHFTYSADRAQSYRDIARPILASLRANNRKAVPAADGIGQLLGSLDRLTCEGLPRQRDEAGPMLILLSAYTGETVRSLGSAAGFADLADDILENYGLSDLDADRRDAIMNGIIAAHPTVVRAVAQDVDRYGDQLCLVLADPEQNSIHTLVERQQDFRSTYHPLYLRAQELLYLHGCTDPDHDGAFGPMTTAAWSALAQATGLPAPEGRPTPGDVVAAAKRPMAAGACDSDAFDGAETIIALDFLDQNDSGWLQSLTPERVELFDRLGRAPDWTRFGERLAESVFTSYGLTPARKRAMLADIYADGIGVSRSDAAALHWRRLAADSPEPYQLYQAARSNPRLAVTAARAAIEAEAQRDREFGNENGEIYRHAAGPLAIDGRTSVSVAELADLARLAELAQDDPEAARLLLEEGSVHLAIKLADRLLEGATPSGRDPELAARFLAAAADRGDSFATSRLAFLHRHGLGVAQDLELARRMAERAAEAGEPFAAYQLATILDVEGADVRRTIALYGQALAPLNEGGMPNDDIRSLVVNRIVASSGALASPLGRTLLDEQVADDPFLARALADAFLCTECGGPVDVAAAATWLRRAAEDDDDAAYLLATLLRARPSLESKPGEAAEKLAANVTPAENGSGALFGYDTHLASYLTLAMDRADPASFASDMAEVLDAICGEANGRCEEAAGLFASGRLDVRLIAQGIERLERLGSPSLIDIRAAYGDFEGALALARQAADDGTLNVVVGDALDGVSAERDPTLRRLFVQRSGGALKSLPPALEPFLRILARNGDEKAEAYLDMMFELPQEPAPVRRDTARAAQTYETVAARGGLSRALVNAAREYSLALTADGAAEPALRLELAALSAELALDDIAALTSSPIQNGLTRVCHLSRASERAFDLGASDVAMVLAKDAVNALQRIRSDLSAVPERLQTCFRDLVADNYRWLADLLIRQNRLSEAEFVMGLLKDFEAFQFVERDPAFVGRSYEELPFSDEEETLRQALQALVPPTVEDARRSDALRTKRALEGLNADEARELAAIEDRLNAADAAFERGLDDIIAAAETLGRGTEPRACPISGRCRATCRRRSRRTRRRSISWCCPTG